LSDFKEWDQLKHAKDWLIFPENMGRQLSIDEVALSQGELYTVITNKKAKGKAGSIVAIINGTKAETVIGYLNQIPLAKRRGVKEITLDMAPNMKLIVKTCFSRATQVIDRFHVQKLAIEAIQEIRIKYRWEAIEQENTAILDAKRNNKNYKPELLLTGETRKQILARSRYILYKSREKWTIKQAIRAEILFKEYPEIKQAYELSQELRIFFNTITGKSIALTKLAQWYDKVEKSGFKSFATIMNTIKINYQGIVNYFENRSTNAAAESFNAKIKAFRSQFRGVRNVAFFLFRLTKIYA
jgi:transposase